MIWVWVQSLVVLTLVFSGGLWFGGALVSWTSRPVAKPAAPTLDLRDEIVMPAYHGADIVLPEPGPEPEPEPLPVAAEPARVLPAAPVATAPRWELLYPINQFGVISVTRAPV